MGSIRRPDMEVALSGGADEILSQSASHGSGAEQVSRPMRDFFRPGRSPVSGLDCAVASSHPLATTAAITTMARGGNAIDAAVTATAVLCVVEPQSTGIGGDCFALISRNGGVPPIGYNGSGRSPMAMPREGIGEPGLGRLAETSVHAVTVPGLVEALARLLADHGTISLAGALAPAIRYAAEGFPVHQKVAAEWATVEAKLAATEDARAICLPQGRVPRPGAVIRLPALAATLTGIAEAGASAFYSGAIAEAMAACLRRHGGHHAVASKVSDVAKRTELYSQAADVWMQDLPVIYIYHHKRFFGLDSGLEGFTPVPDGIIRVKGIKGS